VDSSACLFSGAIRSIHLLPFVYQIEKFVALAERRGSAGRRRRFPISRTRYRRLRCIALFCLRARIDDAISHLSSPLVEHSSQFVNIVTGSLVLGGAVAMIEPLCNTVAYFFHERVWERIRTRWARAQAAADQVMTRVRAAVLSDQRLSLLNVGQGPLVRQHTLREKSRFR
jgi:uncharacterized membrane protein